MKCPIDPKQHDCVALDLYKMYPNDYPYSPCTNCSQKRINELENKIKAREQEIIKNESTNGKID